MSSFFIFTYCSYFPSGALLVIIIFVIILCCVCSSSRRASPCRRSWITAMGPYTILLLPGPRSARSRRFWSFFCCLPCSIQAEIAVQMCLRSVDQYEYQQQLPRIGSRLEKIYYDVYHQRRQERCLGQMIEKVYFSSTQ